MRSNGLYQNDLYGGLLRNGIPTWIMTSFKEKSVYNILTRGLLIRRHNNGISNNIWYWL